MKTLGDVNSLTTVYWLFNTCLTLSTCIILGWHMASSCVLDYLKRK